MNKELYNKTYKVPSKIIRFINVCLVNNPNSNGVKRAKFLIKNGEITYQNMKRLKNFFDYNSDKDKTQYDLAGGDLMKKFVNSMLNSERDAVERGDDIKRDVNVDVNSAVNYQKTPRLTENEKIENVYALAVIVNEENQILLVKRSPHNEDWEPNKWALVGGTVEKGEEPYQGVVREIFEETGLRLKNFKEKFRIQRKDDAIEHIFLFKYDGDPYNIKLNDEHVAYGWFLPEEIKLINHVPNLIDYINITFKNY